MNDFVSALKQIALFSRRADGVVQVLVHQPCGRTPVRRALQEADLDQIWFVEVFDRSTILGDGHEMRVRSPAVGWCPE